MRPVRGCEQAWIRKHAYEITAQDFHKSAGDNGGVRTMLGKRTLNTDKWQSVRFAVTQNIQISKQTHTTKGRTNAFFIYRWYCPDYCWSCWNDDWKRLRTVEKCFPSAQASNREVPVICVTAWLAWVGYDSVGWESIPSESNLNLFRIWLN